ncbi:MAG: DJ-1/PfpI family protein [Oscillospiraceae bacterium]|nr:DJ-1/PfpI family protein [Oscillospiraceae bacterium]
MIYVFLADGFEETEALATVDLLRRCELDVMTVGIGTDAVRGSHGILVKADISDDDVVLDSSVQMIVLPGGMPGTLNLERSSTVQDAISFCVQKKIYIAAICAAPSILGRRQLLAGLEATCFAGFESQLAGAELSDKKVCVSGNIITSKGPGTVFEFALKLVELLVSKQRSDVLAQSLMLD